MDRIEGMGVTLASTAEMTLTLKQSVAELTNLVESLAAENRELRNELKDVEARLATRIESLDPRIGMLEDDNAELKASLVNAESRWKTLVAEHNRTVEQTRPEIMKEVKRLLVTEGKAPRSNGRVDEDLARAGMYVGYLVILCTLFMWWNGLIPCWFWEQLVGIGIPSVCLF